MNDPRENNSDPEKPPKRDYPQQLQTNNVPTYDADNTNCTK